MRTESIQVDRHGIDSVSLFLKEIDLYGGNCKAPASPEACFLGNAPSLDEARDRILKAGQEGGPYLGSERAQENKTLRIKKPVE